MPTTLLVEDNTVFRELIREILLDHFPDMAVREAPDSSTALAVLRECRPELIFMDINLGGESGLNLTKEIKKLYPWAEIVVLTAYDIREYREAALAAGASKVLIKSVLGEDELLLTVKALVS